ncbi:F-box/LRR-repeat protein 14-like [Schistocerca gregaria]|uniref:F-box/LRR-repeat protein 14-like n=1 Tax=Schistocerca gregaria TaxID=7010 RepID=UPI00211ED5CB|nr:F-box/LRR-repeat protein 14-like [Schistocerca gregaria]XP_049843657.1 F-box/LRR-repeat protein 14-like [Schistocerca gregaria]XP_049843658.1 F-box/LRR-repeat protein 14-like [Schistocerca gregaria]
MEDTVLADLPDEVLLEVFSRLPLADAVTCALHVCAHWRRLFRFRAPWRGRTYEAPDEAQAEEAYLVARMLSTGRDLTLEAGNRFCLRATEDSVTVRWDIFQQEKFELLTAGSRVRSLSIPGDFLVWSNVTSLARCTPQLRSLTVDNGVTDWPSAELSDALARLLGSGLLAELRSLTVEGASSRGVEMDGPLLAACRGCPHLERLHLQWTERLGARGLAGLADLGDLRRLRVSSVATLPAVDFLPAGLEELELSRCHGVRLDGLAAGPALRRLVLDGCALEGERLVGAVGRLASLEEANLAGNRRLRDLSFLRPWVRLRTLDLADCDSFDGDTFGTLGFLGQLRSLNLCRCDLRNVSLDAVLGSLPQLEELVLSGTSVVGGQSCAASLPPGLAELHLSWCAWVDAAVVRELRHLGRLRALRLSRCGGVVGWQQLAADLLPHLPALERLDVSGVGGTAGDGVRDLSFLRHCPQLRALDVGENAGLPPAAYSDLRHASGLRHLDLHGSDLEGVPLQETVGRLSELETLTVYGCRGVRQEELQRLTAFLPKLSIKGKVRL